MTANSQLGLRKLGIAFLLSAGGVLAELSVGISSSGNTAVAQITPDRTLGAESSVVTPLKPQLDQIDGGATRGANLFHSFQDFNIGEGRGAYFANPAGIENIFSRVTGQNPSHLFGTLGVFGNGNLFFLNPNGIIFGSNAKLDIRGSFVVSTASSVAFPDGNKFSATNPQSPPLLTVNVPVPIGLEFESEPGAIANAGNLRVGTNLTLVGGTVASTGQLSAPSGEVGVSTVPNVGVNKVTPVAQLGKAGQLLNLQMRSPTSGSSQSAAPVLSLAELLAGGGVETGLSVNSSGQVELTGSGIAVAPGDIALRQLDAQKATLSATQNLTLVESQLRTSGDMHLLARDTVRVQDSATSPFIAESGGKLLLQGDRGVDIFALNHKNSGFFSGGDMVLRSANTIGGDAHYYAGGNFRIEQLDGSLGNLSSPYDPIIKSLGDVSFNSYSGASLHILAAGQVNIGQVTITGAETGTVGNDYLNETVTLSNSKTVVPVNGSVQPTLDVRAGVDPAAIGNSGGVTGQGLLDIFDTPLFGKPIISSTAKSADINIGSITINQPNGLVLLTNQYKPNTKLNGNIQVATIRVDDKAGGLLGGFTGNGGDVFFDSRGNITIPSSGEIKTDSGTGNAGDITLIANDSISLLDKVRITSNTRGSGKSGGINIQAGSFSMTGGASLDTSTFGRGNAGDINIDVRDAASLTESIISSNIGSGAVANGGNISIKAGELSLLSLNGTAQLQSSVVGSSNSLPAGQGNAGNVSIDVRDTVKIIGRSSQGNPSGIFTDLDSDSVGNGGKIKLRAGSLLMDSGMLSTQTSGQGNAGNIEIETGLLQLRNSGVLWAGTSGKGNAGNISVKADNSVSLSDNSFILSGVESKGVGNSGNVDIKTRTLSLINGSGLYTISESDNFPAGKAGNIRINASDSVNIFGVDSSSGRSSGLFAGTNGNSNAQAGKIEATTGKLRIANGAVVDTLTSNSNNGGEITINADSLELTGGGQVLAVTRENGKAGNINLNVANQVTISGSDPTFLNRSAQFGTDIVRNEGSASGLFAGGSHVGSTGNGGQISIKNTKDFNINNGGKVSTAVFDKGDAGNISIVDTSKLNISNGGQILTLALGNGNGGDLSINGTSELNISNGGQIFTGTSGKGNGGNLSIKDTGSVNLVNNGLIATTSFGGAAGGVLIDVQNLSVRDASKISSATAGTQTGGDFTVRAANSVEVVNDSQLAADTINSGSAGNLTVETRIFTVRDRSVVSAGTLGSGQGGNLRIKASDSVKLQNQGIITTSSIGTGDGGNLDIETARLDIQDASAIATNTTGSGAAGNLTVKTTDSVNISNNSKLSADTSGSGKGGDLTVDTGSLRIQSNSKVSSLTTKSGNAGNLKVQVSDSVSVDSQSGISTFSTDIGAAGDLFISAKKLSVRDDSLITTSTLGSKNAGNLAVQATDLVELVNRSVLSSGTLGSGNGGDLAIATRNLSLANTSAVLTSTTSSGRGGNLKVQASDSVNLDNESGITTSSTDTGAAGNLSLETRRVSLRNRSGLATTTLGSSNAGDLIVKAADSVEVVDDSRLLADTRSSGNGGNLIVQTDKFSIRNNSEVSAGTASSGRGGTVKVEAYDFVEISNSSGLFTLTAGSGHGGDMTVDTSRLIAKDGGRIEAGTIGIAPGGNLTINALESIDLSGSSAGGVFRSGLSAYSLTAGNARSGDLNIATGQLNIRNGAEVTVTSFQGQAGNINVAADSVSLNQGYITAETRLGEGEGGANINLRLAGNLFLTNESLVSATAFDAANGGNVTINAQFLIAFPPIGPEGSDIIANAYLGNGGRVNVSAQRLFDIDFRKRRTPLNDITASSEFGNPGVVAIDELGIDPNRGLANLPGDPGNIEVRDGCQASVGQADVAFYNIGRGGLPPRPDEPFHADTLVTDWILFEPEIGKKPEAKNTINLFDSDKKTLARVSNWDSEESHTAKTPNFSTQLSPLCQRVKQFQFAK